MHRSKVKKHHIRHMIYQSAQSSNVQLSTMTTSRNMEDTFTGCNTGMSRRHSLTTIFNSVYILCWDLRIILLASGNLQFSKMAAELELENQSRDTVSPPQLHTHSNGGTPKIHSHVLHISLTLSRLMTYIYIYIYICRTAQLTSRCCIFYLFNKYTYWIF